MNYATPNDVDESHRNKGEPKKPDMKEDIIQDSIHKNRKTDLWD